MRIKRVVNCWVIYIYTNNDPLLYMQSDRKRIIVYRLRLRDLMFAMHVVPLMESWRRHDKQLAGVPHAVSRICERVRYNYNRSFVYHQGVVC